MSNQKIIVTIITESKQLIREEVVKDTFDLTNFRCIGTYVPMGQIEHWVQCAIPQLEFVDVCTYVLNTKEDLMNLTNLTADQVQQSVDKFMIDTGWYVVEFCKRFAYHALASGECFTF